MELLPKVNMALLLNSTAITPLPDHLQGSMARHPKGSMVHHRPRDSTALHQVNMAPLNNKLNTALLNNKLNTAPLNNKVNMALLHSRDNTEHPLLKASMVHHNKAVSADLQLNHLLAMVSRLPTST
jgi:hypothetical protein